MTTEKPPENAVDGTESQGADQDQGQTQDRQERRDDRRRAVLREVEAERDALKGRLDAMVAAEVERQLGALVVDTESALKLGDKQPGDFVNQETGVVDAELVATFAREVTSRVPALRAGLPTLTGDNQRRLTKDTVLKPSGGAGWGDLLASGGSTT